MNISTRESIEENKQMETFGFRLKIIFSVDLCHRHTRRSNFAWKVNVFKMISNTKQNCLGVLVKNNKCNNFLFFDCYSCVKEKHMSRLGSVVKKISRIDLNRRNTISSRMYMLQYMWHICLQTQLKETIDTLTYQMLHLISIDMITWETEIDNDKTLHACAGQYCQRYVLHSFVVCLSGEGERQRVLSFIRLHFSCVKSTACYAQPAMQILFSFHWHWRLWFCSVENKICQQARFSICSTLVKLWSAD